MASAVLSALASSATSDNMSDATASPLVTGKYDTTSSWSAAFMTWLANSGSTVPKWLYYMITLITITIPSWLFTLFSTSLTVTLSATTMYVD